MVTGPVVVMYWGVGLVMGSQMVVYGAQPVTVNVSPVAKVGWSPQWQPNTTGSTQSQVMAGR